MNRVIAQKLVVTVAVIVTVLALVFPPWVQSLDVKGFKMTLPYRGHYAPIYSPPDPEPVADIPTTFNRFWSVQLDSRRLVNVLGIIWVVAAFAIYLLRAKGKAGQ